MQKERMMQTEREMKKERENDVDREVNRKRKMVCVNGSEFQSLDGQGTERERESKHI